MQVWPKERWASKRSALLKGNALEVFNRMSTYYRNEYDFSESSIVKSLLSD